MTIYDDMHAQGLTHSRRHWSTAWLGRAANYSAIVGDRLSVQVAICLVCKLLATGHRDLATKLLTTTLKQASETRHTARVR